MTNAIITMNCIVIDSMYIVHTNIPEPKYYWYMNTHTYALQWWNFIVQK